MSGFLWTILSSFIRQGLMAAGVWLATKGFIADGGSGWSTIVGLIMAFASSFMSGKNAFDVAKIEQLIAAIMAELKFTPGVAAGPIAGSTAKVVKQNFNN